MHRIDAPGSEDGTFVDPKPAQGVRGTNLAAVWFNDLQNNVMDVLEEGGIEPTKNRSRDLADAIVAIAAAAGGGGGGSEVPATRLINTSGLATGGGSLAANRTITVTAASAAETKAAAIATKAITPAGLLASLDIGADAPNLVEAIAAIASGGGNGGLIIKAGSLAIGSGASTVATRLNFPAPFPNALLSITGSADGPASATWTEIVANFRADFDETGGTVVCGTTEPTQLIDPGKHVRWIAIGN